MDELNKHEADNLTLLITLILTQAKWLVRALIISGLLWLASLVLSGLVIGILLTVLVWYAIGNVVTICALAVLAYYYTTNCVSRRLQRFSERAKKKAGR